MNPPETPLEVVAGGSKYFPQRVQILYWGVFFFFQVPSSSHYREKDSDKLISITLYVKYRLKYLYSKKPLVRISDSKK